MDNLKGWSELSDQISIRRGLIANHLEMFYTWNLKGKEENFMLSYGFTQERTPKTILAIEQEITQISDLRKTLNEEPYQRLGLKPGASYREVEMQIGKLRTARAIQIADTSAAILRLKDGIRTQEKSGLSQVPEYKKLHSLYCTLLEYQDLYALEEAAFAAIPKL